MSRGHATSESQGLVAVVIGALAHSSDAQCAARLVCVRDARRQLLAALRRCQRHRTGVAQLFCSAFPGYCSTLVLLVVLVLRLERTNEARSATFV